MHTRLSKIRTFSFLIWAYTVSIFMSQTNRRKMQYTHLLLRSKVVHDVEQLTDFFWCLSLDHVGYRFAAHIAKT
jgi:hypothetical protein